MALRNIDFGSFPDDPNADAIRSAFQKTQLNFQELYAGLESQAVYSVNKTPGAGITVNSPTGNVVVTANIACVQVQTSTLSIGISANGANRAVLTSTNQVLVVDLPPVITGISGIEVTGNITANYLKANLETITEDLTVNANAVIGNNLGVTGNISAYGIEIVDANVTGNLRTSNLEIIGNVVSTLAPSSNIYTLGTLTQPWGNVFSLAAYINGNVQVTGNIISNNITNNNLIITTDLDVTNDILANNVSVNNNTITNNLTVNLHFSGNTANLTGNLIVNNITNNNLITTNDLTLNGNPVMGIGAITPQYNTEYLTGNVSIPGDAEGNATSVLSFTLPNQGTWQINSFLIGQTGLGIGGATAPLSYALYYANGSVVANSNVLLTKASGTAPAPLVTGAGLTNITTAASETITVKAWGLTGTGPGAQNPIIVDWDSNGRSSVSYLRLDPVATISTASNVTFGNLTVTGNTSLNIANVNNLGVSGNAIILGNANVGNLGTAGSITANGNLTSLDNLVSNSLTGRTSGVTITATGTNQNITLMPTGSGYIDVSGFLIKNVTDPVSDQDAATKAYVDAFVQGLSIQQSCNVATTNTLAIISGGTVTYNNGLSGVGANLTTTGSFNTIDSVSTSDGMRILVKNEANAVHNGIYVRSNSTVLTRALDFDTPTEMAGGDFTFVISGTINATTGWVMYTPVAVVGVDNVEFLQFSGAGTYTAGTGLTLTGTQFNITNTAVTTGSYGNGDRVASFTVNQQGQLTAASNTVITANAGNLTGTTLNSGVVNSSLTSVGTLTSLAVTGNVIAGNVYANSGTIGSSLLTGTLTTAAQPNITSIGALTSLSVSGNVTAGNLYANSGTLGAGNLLSTTLTTGSSATPGTITGNWALSSGSRLQATYADLAELYQADNEYQEGTVLLFGGEYEVTISNEPNSTRIAGVVSSNPALILNSELQGSNVVHLAMIGRVPTKVIGPVSKGDIMVSAPIGYAIANNQARAGTILGKALENFDGDKGIIEVVIGKV